MNIKEIMNYIVQRRANNLPASALAKVFDRLIWCLDDNGSELCKVRESWLESEDKYKVEIALLMEEVFPFKNTKEMEQKFSQIVSKYPEFEQCCSQIIEKRKNNVL